MKSDWKMTGSLIDQEDALGTVLAVYLISLIPLVCSHHLKHPSRERVGDTVLLALPGDPGQPGIHRATVCPEHQLSCLWLGWDKIPSSCLKDSIRES